MEWTPEKVTRFWDFYAAVRQADFFSEKNSQALASAVLRVGHPRLLVDIGCGTGALLLELAGRGINGIGVDSSPAAVSEASSKSAVHDRAPEFRLGSVTSLPVGDGEVDFATLIEVIEHLDDAALQVALAETRRVLAEGGTLMITTPNGEDLAAASVQCPDCGAEFHAMQHVQRWTAASLEARLAAAGFGDPSVRPVRFVENGPRLERLARSIVYRLRPLRPRLLAVARRR